MTMFVQSADGTTPGAVRSALPIRFARNAEGAWSIPTEATAAEFGWHRVTETPRPTINPWDSVDVVVVHDGDRFVQEWTVTEGVRPLIDPAQWPDDDERIATDALLTEDSVGYRAVVELLIAKGIITAPEVAAAQAKALARLVTLADQPGVRRQMMADRIARAEAARDA